jgi:hypothetical protein
VLSLCNLQKNLIYSFFRVDSEMTLFFKFGQKLSSQNRFNIGCFMSGIVYLLTTLASTT